MTETGKARKTISQVKQSVQKRNRIAALRIDAGLNMREVSKLSGVGSSTICRVEAGKAPDIRTAILLARFFETSVEDLFHEFAE